MTTDIKQSVLPLRYRCTDYPSLVKVSMVPNIAFSLCLLAPNGFRYFPTSPLSSVNYTRSDFGKRGNVIQLC